ncbi:phospholipid-translocating ATPase RSB1 [Sugiyamaella lignohabitans]|uniref:Sphingoid long-chain base transporter RSB1 n=1 Tax=Sugiyamaella lignohabitans TaxID=796027 RepID=A0A167CS14_9ASCO|nr:phospholipid-translocating ATPase RSB1 [Sugiyamaella lignohabitans]ANB12041.1 phospholipid-translocating ATPase RSB1 [Sugiyamaella lignohabitans]
MSSTVPSSVASAVASAAIASASATGGGDQSLYGGLIPSHSANLAGVILFAIVWAYHTITGVYFRQYWFSTAFFIGAGLETAGYIGRFSSSTDIDNENDFLVQIICLTLAPAFFMGGVYYLLAKLVTIYGQQYSMLKPMHYSLVFILCDLCSIVIQAVGKF